MTGNEEKTAVITEIIKLCAESCCSDYFTIIKFSQSKIYGLSSYDKTWVSHYQENNYWQDDPVLKEDLMLPIIWGEASIQADTDSSSKKVILEARDFSIKSGMTLKTPLLNGEQYAITLASSKEEVFFKKDVTPISVAQSMQFGLILNKIFDESLTIQEAKDTLNYLKGSRDIFDHMQRNYKSSVDALNVIKKEISFSAPASILDKTNFLIDFAEKKLTDL